MSDRRSKSFPAVSALGGQWIQCCMPEQNEGKLLRNKEHTMQHYNWDSQEIEQGLKLTDYSKV